MSVSRSRCFLFALLMSMSGRAAAQYGEPYEGSGYGGDDVGGMDSYGDGLPDPGTSGDTWEEPRKDKDPMNWIGVGLKAGLLYFGDATFDAVYYVNGVPVAENKGVPARAGVLLSLPVNLGGAGFGWLFEPYLGLLDIGSYGAYTGPTITLHMSDMTYLAFGLGVRFGVITQDFWGERTDVGLDVYGRLPVVLTYYPGDDAGLLLDVGFGLGGTGYRPVYTQQQVQPGVAAPRMEMQFGFTFQIDASAGVRFP